MLKDTFFTWPYPDDSLTQCIADLRPLFDKSGVAAYERNWDGKILPPPATVEEKLLRGAGDIVEFVALLCREWNISPWWLVVSAQREQSSMSTATMDLSALHAWLGVVNSDVGRTSNPAYYGVYAQVVRFVETSAWLLGVEDSKKWPEYVRSRKTAPRYRIGLSLDGVEKLDGTNGPVLPISRGDFLQLAFTPHEKVLRVNEGIALDRVPAKFL